MLRVTCPYCERKAELVKGVAIYGHHRPDLMYHNFWRCVPCGAHVGCHPNSFKPLGRLANAALRKAKMAAHAAFDPLWKSGEMTRTQAYAWLAQALDIRPADCHIGMFSEAACNAVIAAVAERQYVANMERAYPHIKGEAE